MKNIFIACCFLLSISNYLHAEDKVVRVPDTKLFNVAKTFSADFEQLHKSIISGKMKSSLGKIEYRALGFIRLEFTSPDKITYVSNGKTSWYYTAPFVNGQKGEVKISNEADKGPSKIFDMIKAGLTTNKDYKVEVLNSPMNGFMIEPSVENQKNLGIKNARLAFANNLVPKFGELLEMEIFYTNQKNVLLKFKNIKLDISLPDATFNFEIPANTQIVQQ